MILRNPDSGSGFFTTAVGSVAGYVLILKNGILATYAGCQVESGRADAELGSLLDGKLVRVEPAGPSQGGLVPCWVFVSTGERECFVNAWLIERGHARFRSSATGKYDSILRKLRR